MSESWKNKFPLGSQWETRGGWRAVVVKYDGSSWPVGVWHDRHDRVDSAELYHEDRGQCGDADEEYDLIKPWKESRTGEGWLNIYETDGGWQHGFLSRNPDYCHAETDRKEHYGDRIACVHIKWTEGEGMEDSE